MAFSKKNNSTEVAIEVTHKWYPDTQFVFHFPKRLPQAAAEAEARFVGMKDGERGDEYRRNLIEVVAQMLLREPEGFDDFPAEESRPLSERARSYFDDESQPELEVILAGAWRAYKVAAIPAAYIKSS